MAFRWWADSGPFYMLTGHKVWILCYDLFGKSIPECIHVEQRKSEGILFTFWGKIGSCIHNETTQAKPLWEMILPCIYVSHSKPRLVIKLS